ncbi:hypothetical protein WJX82_005265 [Trebouxia sp. C0006]
MDIEARKKGRDSEDAMLENLVGLHGTKKWVWIAYDLQNRTSKQCRRRWKSMQDAELKVSGTWSPEEDALLLLAHQKHGNKWIEIAKMVGGRTDNAAKNRWATINKRHPNQQQPGSTNSALSTAASRSKAEEEVQQHQPGHEDWGQLASNPGLMQH